MSHRLAMQKCHVFLVDQINDIPSIVDRMIEAQALTSLQAEEIKAIGNRTRRAQVMALLAVVRKIYRGKFKAFMNALKETHNHVACYLESKEPQQAKTKGRRKMDPMHKAVIKETKSFLIDNIVSMDSILDILYQEEEISWDNLEEIESVPTSSKRLGCLLDRLVKCGPTAYKTFLRALEETDQDHVVEKMKGKLEELTTRTPHEPQKRSNDKEDGVASKRGKRTRTVPPVNIKFGQGKASVNPGVRFSKVYHNDNQFVLDLLQNSDPKKQPASKACIACETDFMRKFADAPFDIVLKHEEHWEYQYYGAIRKSSGVTTKFVCPKLSCVRRRYPYFFNRYIEIPQSVLSSLNETHKDYLLKEFSVSL